ncbi:MAG TPA: MFS transporter [Chloroflexia bacterium]|nr:MFS transporter [Chloroflexia bacterium]
MRSKFTGLWQHPDFLKLWAGETVSLFGSQVTLLALPLTAVLVLDASPSEMGLLGAVEFLPFLVLSLFAGVWVDRLRRRPILISADFGRAILLASVPLAAAFNFLSMPYLYVVALLTGVLTVFFDVAYQSYLPSLVERQQLVEGNGKLEVSRSVAQIAGPGVAGTLVQLVTAPIAIAVDAVSFLLSALFLSFIKKAEPPKVKTSDKKTSIWKEIGEGLGVVLGNRVLRSIAGCTSTSNLFGNILQAVFTIYVIRELKLNAATLGLVLGVGSIGALLGALSSGWLARRLGLGRTIVISSGIFGVGNIFFVVTGGAPNLAIPLLIAGYFISSFSNPVYNINQVSLRQAITPHHLQGRMNASMRFMVWGTMPIGSIIGGLLGDAIGLWGTIVVGTVGSFLAVLWVFFSPVRALQSQPEPVVEETLTPAAS